MRFHRSRRGFRGLVRMTAAVLATATLGLTLLAGPARAAGAREDLAKAEDSFVVADFPAALAAVDTALRSGDLQGGELCGAWVLRARCEIALAQRANATEAFCAALRVEPSWRPDPNLFTTDESEVFEKALAGCGTVTPAPAESPVPSAMPGPLGQGGKPWYKRPVFMAAGGVVVVGVIEWLLNGGDDQVTVSAEVPGFPDPPQ